MITLHNVPAENLLTAIAALIDNEELDDATFRQVVYKMLNNLIKCPFCGSEKISRHEDTETFPYGDSISGNLTLEIEAKVLVSGCSECGQRWTDGDQEDARSNAIIKALYQELQKVTNPVKIS